jgi:hypothetical protein
MVRGRCLRLIEGASVAEVFESGSRDESQQHRGDEHLFTPGEVDH